MDSALHKIQLMAKGRLVLLLKSAQMLVWDVERERSTLRASIRYICKPRDVLSFTLQSETDEPIISRKDGRHFLFRTSAQTWLSLPAMEANGAERPASTSQPESWAISDDLLSAACVSHTEFQVRLASLGRYYAVHDVQRLSCLCAELLGGHAEAPCSKEAMERYVAGLGSSRKKLVTDVLLPALRELPAGQQFSNELSRLLEVSAADLAPIF